MNFSDRLFELRSKHGLTQKQAANLFEISCYGYQRYEYGEAEPKIGLVLQMADFFHVSVDYLVGRTDNPEVNK